MKKIITIIFCLLVSATMMGQDCLTFMGVPTKGSVYEIVEQLEEKGFKTSYSKKWKGQEFEDIKTLKAKYGTKWTRYWLSNIGWDYWDFYNSVWMHGMFCGEWCEICLDIDTDKYIVTRFIVRTHSHNNITKERVNNMYNSFKQYYTPQTFPSLLSDSEVITTVSDNTGEPIGIVTFRYASNTVQIYYNNIEKKPKKTFHKCDEHCDGYWCEDGMI